MLAMDKREKRLQKKKRKIEAFLEIAALNDHDKEAAKKIKLGEEKRILLYPHVVMNVQSTYSKF